MSQELLKNWQATSGEAIEQTKEEARGAMDNYFDFLHKTISSCPTGGTQLGEKLKSYSEKNIAVARDYMHKLESSQGFHGSRANSDRFHAVSIQCVWRAS